MTAMGVRNQLKALLKRKDISGFDVAKIALHEMWEGEHAKDGLLTEAEREAMFDALRSSAQNAAQYQNWIDAYGAILELNSQAHIACLSVQKICFQLLLFLRRYIGNAFTQGQDLDELKGLLFHVPDEDFWKEMGNSPGEYMRNTLQNIRSDLEVFFFSKKLLAAVKEETGVCFDEHFPGWEQKILFALEFVWDTFDAALYFSKEARADFAGIVCQIELSDLRPSEKIDEFFKAKLRQPLKGDQWLFDCRDRWFREKLQHLSQEEIERRYLLNPSIGNKAKEKVRSLIEEVA